MSQEIINYGAAPNDGTGDPLRVAFIKTDNNFDQIWAAGPVGSNITILNNTIQVTNTNGNLELATNGTGVISTRNHVRPSVSQVYDLGTTNLRYRLGYFNGLNIDGNVTITGNLSAGNISYTSNVFVGDLKGSVFADDSTIMVDAIDNVLRAGAIYTDDYFYANGNPLVSSYGNANVTALLGNLGSNTISGTGNITTTANVSGNFILGNGRQLTGIVSSYGNANVTTLLGNLGSNTINGIGNITTTANVSGGYILGNGSQLTGLPAQYGNSNVTTLLGNLGSNTISGTGNITTTGNISGNYFVGNGSQLTGISTANTGNVTFNDINIIGTGNLKLQPDSANASAYLDIYLTGNVVEPDIHIAGNGENIILGTDEQANVAVLTNGNVAIQAGNVSGKQTWNFDTAGNLTLPRGGIVYETNIPDGGLNGNTIALKPSGGTNADQQLLIYPTTNDANHLHLTSGNLYSTELFLGSDDLYVKLANTGNIVVNSNDGTGNTAQWTFGTDGSLTLPIGVSIDYNGNVQYPTIMADSGKLFSVQGQGNTGSAALAWTVDPNAASQYAAVAVNRAGGDNLAKVVLQAQSDSGNVATVKLWKFDETGNLTLPIGGNLIVSGAIVSSGASPAPYLSGFSSVSAITVTASGNVTGGNVLTTGIVSATGNVSGNYFIGNGSQLTGIAASYGNANVANFLAAYGSNTISTTGNITAGNLIGNISITGNVTGTSANVTLVAGVYSWTFDNTGNLTLPGNTFSVNYANNTPVNAVTRFESSWTVPVGNSTQSFTVGLNETYYLWVDCNIANGILAWNATATVTNTNVPVVGAQYAWVYNGGGTPIDFTSIPNQFVGTGNTIVRSSVAPSATTNRFDFGLNNTSGGNVTVRYGWIAIS